MKHENLKDLTIFDNNLHNLIGKYSLYSKSIAEKEKKIVEWLLFQSQSNKFFNLF